ncbi:MAG TPA: restriction endonuclease subunit S [Acidimicrobiales bacterium]
MAEFYDGPHATPPPANEGPVYLGIRNISEDGRLDLSDIRHIDESDYPKWVSRVEPRAGDLVFTYEATLHRYAILPDGFRGSLGRRIALIRVDPDVVDRRFLHYVFLSPQWRRTIEQRLNIGSTVDRIPLTEFPNYPIAVPPLDYQREVVHALGAIDDLIENNRRRIEILEETARLIYREWFVHFRFPGHEGVELVDSDGGSIPEGWCTETLADAAHLVMGQSPKSEFYNDDGVGLPFHQGVTNFASRYPEHKKWCTEANRIAEQGDVLLSVRAPVGRINVAPDRLVIGRGLAALRTRRGSQVHLFETLREVFAEEDSMGGGTIFKAVTKTDLERIIVLRPPADLVSLFDASVGPMFELVQNLTFQNRVLSQARGLLLPRLISGDVYVSDLDLDLEPVA